MALILGDNLDELENHFSQYLNRPVFLQADISDEEITTQLIEKLLKKIKN